MAASSIDALFNPASIAVVGASQREESIGQRVIRNLVRFGFQGSVYPVHPTNAEVAGLACHKSLADIPGPVDAVFIGLPAAQGPGVLEEAGLVEIRKGYEGRRPLTTCRLTPAGRQRFVAYLAVLERVVRDAAEAARQGDRGPEPLPA